MKGSRQVPMARIGGSHGSQGAAEGKVESPGIPGWHCGLLRIVGPRFASSEAPNLKPAKTNHRWSRPGGRADGRGSSVCVMLGWVALISPLFLADSNPYSCS